MPRPYWEPAQLEVKYRKHPDGLDRECWKDMLGRSKTVTRGEYEEVSRRVAARPDLAASFRDKKHRQKRWNFFDRRGIKTVTAANGQFIITCYHQHRNLRHYPLGTPPREVLKIIVDVLANKHKAGLISELNPPLCELRRVEW